MDLMPFGKLRGQPYSELDRDPAYVSWLLAQDWLPEQYPQVHAYLLTLGIAPKMVCRGVTRKGDPCNMWAKHDGYCNRHFVKSHGEDFSAWEAEFTSGEFQPAQ